MTDLLLVRLHPGQQTDAGDFTSWLQGLQITANDLTVATPGQPTQIGSASGLAGLPSLSGKTLKNDKVDLTKTQIIQHWAVATSGLTVIFQAESAATAVITLTAPAGHPEYPAPNSYDVQLVLSRNGQAIPDATIEYNAAVVTVTGPLPTEQRFYFGSSAVDSVSGAPASAASYVTLPAPPPAGAQPPALVLSSDGTPPPFADLVTAIDGVLADDPGGGTTLVSTTQANGQLPVPQCQQVAAEIIWNRAYIPPPAEPADYGLLYTNPDSLPNTDTGHLDSARQQFEGQVTSYHATNDALAGRLAGYVYAASAAVLCEQTSTQAAMAGFPFPLITGQGAPVDTEVEIASLPSGVTYAVPAAYFYALATQLSPQITADQRYKLAVLAPEDSTLQQLTAAATTGTVTSGTEIGGVTQAPEGFLLNPSWTAININQAARRLAGLGTVSGSLPNVTADAGVTQLVSDWLGYSADTATIDANFWPGEVGPAASAAQQADYLDLVLQVVTGEQAGSSSFTAFLAAIQAAPLSIATVPDLAATSDQAWQAFFLANPALLPPFTQPGTVLERIASFIRHLQKFFTTPIGQVPPRLQALGAPPSLGPPAGDVLALFAQNYNAEGGGTFTFGTAWDQTAVTAAVTDTFPGDTAAQAWLTQALTVIQALYDLTAFAESVAATKELRFSLMEALYACGFTSAASAASLTASDFAAALEGSVAYPYATQIQAAAGGPAPEPPPAGTGFQPVNPDGSLTNCVPPEHLSPFGPVAYLSELLRASAASTCAQPEDPDVSQQIGTLLASRRGPLGNLLATRANLETPLPAIDLVNESLEALAAAAAADTTGAGAVYDTSPSQLAGLPLRRSLDDDSGHGRDTGRGGLDRAEAFAAIAEHSSPAALDSPAAQTSAYSALRADFSAPALPYDQPLDVCRSYLCRMQTSRFETMRRFRKDITEFVLDPAPADEPQGFQSSRWRYPVSFDLALEYLGISAAEYAGLFSQPLPDQPGPGQPALWQLYGFAAAESGDTPWTTVAAQLTEFLRRTGLSYCDLVGLQHSGIVPFSAFPAPREDAPPAGTTTAPGTPPGATAGPGPTTPAAQPPPGSLPECEPCCPAQWVLDLPSVDDTQGQAPGGGTAQGLEAALYELAIVIRLWRRLRERAWCDLTFADLAKITSALSLFGGTPSSPVINPDFLRQLAALLILRDDLRVSPLPLLALWSGPNPPASGAVTLVLGGIRRHARSWYQCPDRGPAYTKVIASNLDALSVLAGFDPQTPGDTWHALPTHTLRFAEVLGKVYASQFSVGELLFCFTTLDHLDGDDPFPLPDANEVADDPLALPEAGAAAGDGPHSLWALRRALLDVHVSEEAARRWHWARITATLREEFGYTAPSGGPDPLTVLGQRFFPSVLERDGLTVGPQAREFRTHLDPSDTTPGMWDSEAGPFRYDQAAGQLYTRLPLRDSAVIGQLRDLRQLRTNEQAAVQSLYLAPRAALSPFSMVFENFGEAADFLAAADSDEERFGFFQYEFARFHARCQVITRHLARHVDAVAGRREHAEREEAEREETGREETERDEAALAAAWRVLRAVLADGNIALTPWEDDSGQPPAVTWGPAPQGGAFAALLGLTGTGLLGEFTVGATTVWPELRGPLRGFGPELDEHNCPVPTIVPPLGLTLTAEQLRLAGISNGFAIRDTDGEPLGGGAPFTVRWTGSLLVERPGDYRFFAGAPAEREPDFRAAQDNHWRVTLNRGQKTWTVLSHGHADDAPPARSEPVRLRRGVYAVTAEFTQREPLFEQAADVCPVHTGFEVAYAGPDTDEEVRAIPARRLFRPFTGATLADIPAAGADSADGGTGLGAGAMDFLAGRYVPDLRDIRRTYQRAVKALLLAERFRLSARTVPRYRESELGYLLAHPEQFQGTSYYRTGTNTFGTHHAWFDLDLLPVADPYPPPLTPPGPPTDERGYPSPRRQAALFDWWERLFDYCWLREQTERARERPPWLLFDEAAQDQPDLPGELVRHLGVDLRFAPLVLTYFDTPDEYTLVSADLADERWAVRVWHGAIWLRRLEEFFTPADIAAARPDLWASDDPSATTGSASVSGNANLTQFVQGGCLGAGTARRYGEVRDLDDGLRERARDALAAYLCAMGRVTLPWSGSAATEPADISDLLLQDVRTGLCTRMSRVEDAIRAVQAFVQRARLGLEPSFPVTPAFAALWEKRFASLHIWQACRRREVYSENWIEWDDLRAARRVAAFRFLEEQLRRDTLSVAVPGGDAWWPGPRPPAHPSLRLLQDREPATLVQIPTAAAAEGLGLLGARQRAASHAWLAPVLNPAIAVSGGGSADSGTTAQATGKAGSAGAWGGPAAAAKPARRSRRQTAAQAALQAAAAPAVGADASAPAAATAAATTNPGGGGTGTGASLPWWLQAAIGLGVQYVRVAAAGIPPACAHFSSGDPASAAGCCAECEDEESPAVDEYYFWLAGAQQYLDTDVIQEADATASGSTLPPGASSGWEDPAQLPGMLLWNPEPIVHLYWSRVRRGEFSPPRRSSEGLLVTNPPPAGQPQLVLAGRTGDSLRFIVSNGVAATGYTDPTAAGFRYDLADDGAVPLPLVAPAPALDTSGDYGLAGYPYFAYVSPGAPVEPLSAACVAATVARPLRTHCRFEAALKWYELAYQPLTSDNTWAQCESQDVGNTNPPGAGKGTTPVPTTSGQAPADVAPPVPDLPCCPSAPVTPAVARQRAALLAYLETLLQWGDATACRDSAEAAQRAKVVFETLSRVLGEPPVTILSRDDGDTTVSVADFQPRPAPLSPRLVSLYERCADRLALVRDCLDGRRLRLATPRKDRPFWGDDPVRDGWREVRGPCEGEACQAELCHDENGLCCCGPYRFSFWVRYALELASETRTLGAELLSAYEKGDAEVLAALRATHERQLAELVIAARQYTWREADWQVQALEMTKQGAQARYRYYQQLLAAGLIDGETAYQALTGVAVSDHGAANVSEAIGQAMEYIPDIAFGVAGLGPYLSNQMPIGTKLAGTFSTVARIINTEAEMATTNGGLNLTQAGWDRRTLEWQLQVETIGIEIDQIQRQILAAERHRDMALRDLNDSQRALEHAGEVEDFLRDKFTTADLYLYLQQQTAGLYRQTYDLALHAARRAQRAFNRELGHTARRFLPDPGWDDLHEGLLAGDRLQLALRQMETAYTDLNCREYELTKHLSLRLDFPLAYLHLRTRGWAEIEVPEWMFDLDYPGQYLRRIKNVTLTAPLIAGPYTGVHAKLTLLGSATRVDPRLAGPRGRCCDERHERGCGSGACRCREECGRCGCERDQPHAGYLTLPGDPRIVREYAATQAIATSSAQNDSGMFELSFRDERYLPFEFAGAVSRWRIELPPENNFFSPDTLTDFVVHMNYSAREGGEALRRAASEQAQCHVPGDGLRLFDVRHDLPEAWARLTHAGPDHREARLTMRFARQHFPYLPCSRDVEITGLDVFVEVADPDCQAGLTARFVARHSSGHEPSEECHCEGTDITCVATPGCPVLYHGILSQKSALRRAGEPRGLGDLIFRAPAERITNVFLVCSYQALAP